MLHAVEKTFLVAQPIQLICTYKSRGISVGGVQTVAAAALVELAIPPSLRYIGSGAFLDCTAFKRLAKMPGKHKWREVHAEENAFAICPDMRWPLWLHMIPDMGHTPGLG